MVSQEALRAPHAGGEMSLESITRLGLILICVLLVTWDAMVVAIGNYDATVSVIVYRESRKHPIIPFLLGLVCGHLLWQIFERP